jgi:sporadic carbohydrate cluster protein (TIGR04323 family)
MGLYSRTVKKIPIFAGYINLKAINGVIFPSYAQNQINKDFIVNKLSGEFYMTTNENTYGKNNIVLRSLLEEKSLNGVCFLSIYSLPENKKQRLKIYKLSIKNKKELHFVFEEKKIKTLKDVPHIEDLFIFNTKFFTEKKTSLSKFERQFLDKSWTFI